MGQSACSLFLNSPGTDAYELADCQESYGAPVLDLLVGSAIAALGGAAIGADKAHPVQDGPMSGGGTVVGVVLVASGVGLLASGAHGASTVGSCRTHNATARTLGERDAMGPALPLVSPGPAL